MKKAVTGHDLLTGAVVYLTPRGRWSRLIKDAALFDPDGKEIELAITTARETDVVTVYAIHMESGEPAGRGRLREAIRATGPTVRPDLARAKFSQG